MNEEQTNNLNPKPQNPPENKPAKAEAENDDLLYFNVAPKTSLKDQIIGPSINSNSVPKINSQEQPQNNTQTPLQINSEPGFFTKNKFFVIVVLALIILAPIGYFLINKFGTSDYQKSDIVINPNLANDLTQKNLAADAKFKTPEEWRKKFFQSCIDEKTCGDSADPDYDGLTNLEESNLQTDPNNADSDSDGIADGDEVHVFSTDPINLHSGNPKYTDAEDIKNSYSKGVKMTPEQIKDIGNKAKSLTVHEPTLKTLGDVLEKVYGYVKPPQDTVNTSTSTPANATSTQATGSPASIFEQTPEAKQDRDAQRTNTVKTYEIALIKYQADHSEFPKTANFLDMHTAVKPYLKIATNPLDPINKDQYVYSYALNPKGTDFTLSFYSESAGQLIKKHLADAKKDKMADEAAIFDDQRKTDLANIQSALLLYSNANISGKQEYVFPTIEKYKTELVPKYLSAVPKDPKTNKDYEYRPSDKFDTFTLKTVLDAPASGTTGYVCNQIECLNY